MTRPGFVLVAMLLWAVNARAEGLHATPSSSWESEVSLECHQRYQKWLKNKQAFLEKEAQLFPQRQKALGGELAKAHAGKEVIAFSRPLEEHIWKYEAPEAADVERPFEVSAARNEWESLYGAVYALKDLKDFSYELSDLVHANGTDKIAYDPKFARLYFVYHLYTTATRDIDPPKGAQVDPKRKGKRGGYKVYEENPCALLDLPSLDVKAHTAQPFLVDFYFPKETAPGAYKGTLTFKAEGKEIASRQIAVTVHPFVLDEAKEWGRGAFVSKFVGEQEAITMVEDGHTMTSWWTSAYTLKHKNGKIDADFSPFVEYLGMLDKAGMTGPHTVFLSGSDPKLQNEIFGFLKRKQITDGRNKAGENKDGKQFKASDLSPPFGDLLCQVLKQWHEQMKACGHGNTVACLLDEPDHDPKPARPTWYKEMYALVEKGAPETPTYGVFYHQGDEDRLSHHHTVWCTNGPNTKIAETCRKAGKNLYTYKGAGNYTNKPGQHRFVFGILPWIFGARGTYFYADLWAKGDFFEPDTVTNGDSATIRTSDRKDRPLRTIWSKGWRESVDDHRYLVTLEKAIAEAEKDSAGKEEAQQHKAWLEGWKKQLYENTSLWSRMEDEDLKAIDKSGFKVTTLKGESGTLSKHFDLANMIRADVAERITRLKK